MSTSNIVLHHKDGIRIAEVIGDGILLRNGSDAVQLMLNAHRAEWIAVHEQNIAPEFFDLRTGIAGDILQKFVNYQTKLAIIGDVSRYTAKSESLAALVRESNRGRDVRFVADVKEIEG